MAINIFSCYDLTLPCFDWESNGYFVFIDSVVRCLLRSSPFQNMYIRIIVQELAKKSKYTLSAQWLNATHWTFSAVEILLYRTLTGNWTEILYLLIQLRDIFLSRDHSPCTNSPWTNGSMCQLKYVCTSFTTKFKLQTWWGTCGVSDCFEEL